MADGHAAVGLDHRREGRRGRAGEDLDLDAALGQPLGQLEHVDVHAARVAGAGLVKRGRVQADHRDARHGGAFLGV